MKAVATTGEELRPGDFFGRYEIIRELGRGGMGVVYKAWQGELKRFVALKVLIDEASLPPEDIKRFEREARAAAALKHPNIVPIHEVGIEAGRHFFSMEFIEGRTLDDLIRAGKTPLNYLVKALAAVCDGVHYAHEAGIVHRDIKPANIIVGKGGVPYIADFGLAKSSLARTRLTLSGVVMGTPSYMSPEQARGDKNLLGPATDVYSLGATLYEILTGQPPFDGTAISDILFKVVNCKPVSPNILNPQAPAPLVAVCLKALEKDIRFRYRTAGQMAEDLRRYLEDKPVRAAKRTVFSVLWRAVLQHRAAAIGFAAALGVLAVLGTTLFIVRERARRAAEVRTVALRQARISELLQKTLAGEPEGDIAEVTELLEQFPDDEKSNLLFALIAVRENRSEDAERGFRLAADPKRAYFDGMYHFGVWLLSRRRYKEAVTVFQSALEVRGTDVSARLGHAEALANAAGESAPEEAQAMLQAALGELTLAREGADHAQRQRIMEIGQLTFSRLAELAKTEEEINRVLAMQSSTGVSADLGALHVRRAVLMLRAGKAAAAWAALNEGGDSCRKAPRFPLIVAMFALGLELPDIALHMAEKALKTGGRTFDTLLVRACARRELGSVKKALADFKAAEKLDPSRPELFLNRGLTLEVAQRYKEALADYDTAARLMGKPDPALRFHIARVCAKLGLQDRAEKEAMALYESAPETLIYNPFNVWGDSIAFKRTLKEIEETLAQQGDTVPLLIRAGDIARLSGQQVPNATALSYYKKALQREPHNAAVWLRLAFLALSEGDESRLLTTLREACNAGLSSDPTVYSLARVFFYERSSVTEASALSEHEWQNFLDNLTPETAAPPLPTVAPEATRSFDVVIRAASMLNELGIPDAKRVEALLALVEKKVTEPMLGSVYLCLRRSREVARNLLQSLDKNIPSSLSSPPEFVTGPFNLFTRSHEFLMAYSDVLPQWVRSIPFRTMGAPDDISVTHGEATLLLPRERALTVGIERGVSSLLYARGVEWLSGSKYEAAAADLKLAKEKGAPVELAFWPVKFGCPPLLTPSAGFMIDYSLAVAYYCLGKWNAALELLAAAEPEAAANPAAFSRPGEELSAQEFFVDERWLPPSVPTSREDFPLLRGLVLHEMGRIEEAIEEYNRMIAGSKRWSPHRMRAVAWKGIALLELGREKEVPGLLEDLKRRLPHMDHDTLEMQRLRIVVAMALERMGKPAEAAKALEGTPFVRSIPPWFSADAIAELKERVGKK